MTFKRLRQEEFVKHSASCAQRSFMQTVEMEKLLSKRGFTCQYVGYTNEHDEVTAHDRWTSHGNKLRPCFNKSS